jgi:hypothetical protein
MFKWLRQRREAARRDEGDAERLRKRNDDGESASNPDPLEELVRIVGESDASGQRRDRKRPADNALRASPDARLSDGGSRPHPIVLAQSRCPLARTDLDPLVVGELRPCPEAVHVEWGGIDAVVDDDLALGHIGGARRNPLETFHLDLAIALANGRKDRVERDLLVGDVVGMVHGGSPQVRGGAPFLVHQFRVES